MKTRSPDSAPQVPPVTGASRKSTARWAQSAATRRSSSGETVLESTSTLPLRNPSRTPSVPQRMLSSAGGSLTMVMTKSEAAATARGDSAQRAPSCKRSSALLAVRFQTVSGNPALSKLRPMGLPISPSPISPTAGFMVASEKKQCTPARDRTGATRNLHNKRATEKLDKSLDGMLPEFENALAEWRQSSQVSKSEIIGVRRSKISAFQQRGR